MVGIDDQGSVIGVDVVALQASGFAPSAAGPCGGDDEYGVGAGV